MLSEEESYHPSLMNNVESVYHRQQ